MQFYSATQDLCFQVYGRRARQLYPWDLESTTTESEKKTSYQFDPEIISTTEDTPRSSLMSMRSFRKSKIFEDELPIEDEYVKNVQRARYIRVWVVATIIAVIVVVVFLAVPNLPY
jgi:hypothetical protein